MVAGDTGQYAIDMATPFLQGDHVAATNGHVILLLDRSKYPLLGEYEEKDQPKFKAILDGLRNAKESIIVPDDFMNEIRAEICYPYRLIIESEHVDCMTVDQCPLGELTGYEIWGRCISPKYLQLLEITMCIFPGQWTAHFQEDKLAAAYFTNGSEMLIIMPMRPTQTGGRIT